MAKVVGFIKLQCPVGKANPAPPVGPTWSTFVNIMVFCKEFNENCWAGWFDYSS